MIGGADKYHAVCRLCYFRKASGQPDGLDSNEDKENWLVPGKLGEAAEARAATGARKPLAEHQILQHSPPN